MSKIDDHLTIEEDFFFHDRKSEKKIRKELSAKDRSKYKKTDQEKLEKKALYLSKKLSSSTTKKGRVLAVTPEGMIVDHEDQNYLCTLKGLLKKERTHKKNLIAVGDFVIFEPSDGFTGVIVDIEPRYSILSRADNLRKNKEQLIAVNIDQLFIVVSVVMPHLKPSLVDRYIIAAKQGNMSPVIILNKVDLLTNPPKELDVPTFKEELALYHSFIATYKQLDIPIIEISTVTKQGLEELREMMKEKASVFSGQSGVGKTTLINCILGTNLKTADVVSRTYKGAHTTTTAQLIHIDHASFCIDTPGIKSFGIWKVNQSDLQNYFYEFQEISKECKYQDCLHLQEPDCAVKKAIEDGTISPMRYQSYYDLVTLPEDNWR